jgi:hypothetical protein
VFYYNFTFFHFKSFAPSTTEQMLALVTILKGQYDCWDPMCKLVIIEKIRFGTSRLILGTEQGDQIGLIFDQWAIVYSR